MRVYIFKKNNKSVFIGPYVEIDPATTKVGKNCAINLYTSISKTTIGDYTYFSANCSIMHANIGSFCSIGPDSKIGLGSHPTDFISTSPIFYSTSKVVNNINWVDRDYHVEFKKVNIRDNVWLGANVFIMNDIEIGEGAICAAGSVITKDVPPYSIVGGIPAKVLKYRFDANTIEQLLELRLYQRSEEWLKENLCGAITPEELLNKEVTKTKSII
ncbi:CatB-related O-acetyltransferase [Bacillus sp. D386]|uniref:CatB-related O-acetyltransferase n=1 Tax=Bacillus sp. D386 TaxID=2587155 RepID=UPI001124ACD9|nr:CatB-related O-acetyltransferase [Bacillus sp. D386]